MRPRDLKSIEIMNYAAFIPPIPAMVPFRLENLRAPSSFAPIVDLMASQPSSRLTRLYLAEEAEGNLAEMIHRCVPLVSHLQYLSLVLEPNEVLVAGADLLRACTYLEEASLSITILFSNSLAFKVLDSISTTLTSLELILTHLYKEEDVRKVAKSLERLDRLEELKLGINWGTYVSEDEEAVEKSAAACFEMLSACEARGVAVEYDERRISTWFDGISFYLNNLIRATN